jgi:ubiquinone/menaquinone biosynthesis C-methylase UbiE
MRIRERFLAGTARQLGHPDGWRGQLVGRLLNRANRTFVRAAVEAVDLTPGAAAADLGFGGGVGVRMLLDAVGHTGRVYGVDVSRTMLERARVRFADEWAAGRLELIEGSLLDLPLVEDSVDAVITVNTFYFLEDPRPALREIARVLRPGGRAVIGIGDPDEMARFPVTAHGFHLRPVAELVAAMTSAGLGGAHARPLAPGKRRAHLLVGAAPA